MKMQESRPTCTKWMSENCHWDGSDEDDDDIEDHYGNLDSVSVYTPAGSDVNTPGPYSVTSFPPSVGVDDEALMRTPHMYAPTSPDGVTPLKSSESDINRSSDDVRYLSSVKKALLLSDSLLHQQTGPQRSNFGPGSNTLGHEGLQEAEFPRPDNATYTELENQTYFFEEESPVFSRQETPSSSKDLVSETVSLEQIADSKPTEERRMSWEEFISSDATWKELLEFTEPNDVQQNVSNNLTDWPAKGTNVPTPIHCHSTKRVRKRTAQESIFSNPDFPDSDREITVKRQKLIPSQISLVPDFQQMEIENTDSRVPENSGMQGFGLAPHVDNIRPHRGTSASAGQNLTYTVSPRDTARFLQFSLTDTGKLGLAAEEPKPSSQAAFTSINSTLDHNGNLVQTNSQQSDKHISPWFVGTTPNLNQQKVPTSFNENTCLQMKQHNATSRSLSTQTNTPTPVLTDTHLNRPHKAAILTTHFPQQIIRKLPEHHPDTAKPAVVQTNSDNQNFILINEDVFQQEGIVPDITTVLAGLIYPDSQIICLPHQNVAACSTKAPSPATTSTSSHDEVSFKDIRQIQENCTMSHLFHRSAGTDHLPLETNVSDIPRLPTDPVTAQVFATNSTDNISLYQTQTFLTSSAVLDNNGAMFIKDVMVSGDAIDMSPSNSLLPALDTYHVTRPSPNGGTYTNPDYLADTNVDVSVYGNSVDQFDYLDVIQESHITDVSIGPTSSDVGTSLAWGEEHSVLADPGQEEDCPISTVDLSGVTDSVGAGRKSKEPGHISVKVKQTLKTAILSKLQKEGKPAIEISFSPPTQHEMTQEEREKEKRRRELNRKAAANHRQKKKFGKQSQEQELEREVQRNVELKDEIAQLQSQILYYKKLLQPQTQQKYRSDN